MADKTYTERDARDWQRAIEALESEVRLLKQSVAAQKNALGEKDAEIARLRAALKPFAEFAKAFNANPMLGGDDALYSIHGGAGAPSGKGAEIRLSDCRAALTALGEEA